MQICPSLSSFLTTIPEVSANWIRLVGTLDQYGYINRIINPPVTFLVPTAAAVAEIQELLGALPACSQA